MPSRNRTERDGGSDQLQNLLALEQEAADLDASRLIGTITRRWWVVVLVPVLLGVLGYLWSDRATPQYEATAYVVLRPTAADAKFAPVDNGDPDRELQTETQYISGGSFHDSVEQKLGRGADYTVAPVFKTSVLAIVGKSTVPAEAADTANAAAELYVTVRREQIVSGLTTAGSVLSTRIAALQTELTQVDTQLRATPAAANDAVLLARQRDLTAQLDGLRTQLSEVEIGVAVTSGGARVSSLASEPLDPVSPKPTRSAVLFAMLGVLVGLGCAVLLENTTDVLGDADELERRLNGVPVLASIPSLEEARAGILLLQAPQSASAEAVRSLRTSLQFLGLDRTLRRIQVTSASEDEGASTVAANLAVAFAGAGLRVVIVDGDLRHPNVHRYFGVDGLRGFTTVLVRQADLGDVMQPIAMQGWLRVLAAGPRPTNPSEILASGHLGRLLGQLEERCDLVIIDSPPVLPYTDAAVIASYVDVTVMVAKARGSKRTPLQRALRRLRLVDANVAGVVISDLDDMSDDAGRRRGRVEPAASA